MWVRVSDESVAQEKGRDKEERGLQDGRRRKMIGGVKFVKKI